MSISDKLTTIAENEQKVYDAGYSAGQQASAEDYDSGYEAGKKAEYERFWDILLDPNTEVMDRLFSNRRWSDEIYNPTHDIILPNNCTGVYMYNNAFTDTKVDITVRGTTQQIFYYCYKLKTIRKLIVNPKTTFSNMFSRCDALENLTIEGTIANAFNISGALALNRASIENVFSCLSDTTTGLTATFSTTAKNNAFTAEEWDALVASKPNWTIALA
jgi:hypothetical protein